MVLGSGLRSWGASRAWGVEPPALAIERKRRPHNLEGLGFRV